MPDDPSVQEEIAAVRAANARLREVVEARDAENAVLRSQLDACQAQMEGLRAELEALRARPGQNPRNSSGPPSPEGPGKPSPRSLRGKSGREPGRPEGQPGATLEMTGRPDLAVPHEPAWCSGCRAGLSGAEVAGIERRQVTGLPEVIRALVTEHRIISRRCSCGTVTAGSVPAGVRAPVRYGHRITAVCAYLRHGQFLSRQRTCQAVTELFGVPVSPGTVAGMIRRAAGSPDGCLEVIRAAVTAAGVAHSDETGFRVAGKLAWVHWPPPGTAATPRCSSESSGPPPAPGRSCASTTPWPAGSWPARTTTSGSPPTLASRPAATRPNAK